MIPIYDPDEDVRKELEMAIDFLKRVLQEGETFFEQFRNYHYSIVCHTDQPQYIGLPLERLPEVPAFRAYSTISSRNRHNNLFFYLIETFILDIPPIKTVVRYNASLLRLTGQLYDTHSYEEYLFDPYDMFHRVNKLYPLPAGFFFCLQAVINRSTTAEQQTAYQFIYRIITDFADTHYYRDYPVPLVTRRNLCAHRMCTNIRNYLSEHQITIGPETDFPFLKTPLSQMCKNEVEGHTDFFEGLKTQFQEAHPDIQHYFVDDEELTIFSTPVNFEEGY